MVSIFNLRKEPGRQFMMNVSGFSFMALFADSIGSCHDADLNCLPPCPIRSRVASISRVTFPHIVLRLIYAHANSITKDRLSMKVTRWSGDFFSAAVTDFGNKIRSAGIWFSNFSLPGTSGRTINLGSSSCACGRKSTYQTEVWFLFIPPAIFKIALSGTKLLRFPVNMRNWLLTIGT